ncbi:hypothetical protein SAMN03097699_2437 [Flavobacteriaceae bacterium MAR_2010_188]|nr:hypothetical protein SAMN03097699_2437 [Flavobacteriaceae bacterium MAR_2010_188]
MTELGNLEEHKVAKNKVPNKNTVLFTRES